MMLAGVVLVIFCAVRNCLGTGSSVDVYQNITVVYTPGDCATFDWWYTASEDYKLIKWSFAHKDTSEVILMVAEKGKPSPTIITPAYNGRLEWSSTKPAQMKLCNMQASDADGVYRVEIELAVSGTLLVGYTIEVKEASDGSSPPSRSASSNRGATWLKYLLLMWMIIS